MTSFTDARGNTHQWVYDDRGLVTSYVSPRYDAVTQRFDGETYTYSETGFLRTVTDGNLHIRQYFENSRDEVYRLNLPDGSAEIWQYDGVGHVTAYWPGYDTPSQYTIEYTYDNDGRLTDTDYPNGTPDTHISYLLHEPATSSSITMQDGTGTTTWQFDSWGQLSSLSTPQGTTSYAYNWLGERTSMTQTGVGTTSYTYDSRGKLSTLTNPHNETTTWQYDSPGRVIKRFLANGLYDQISYDTAGRWMKFDVKRTSPPATLRSQTFNFDAGMNVTSRVVSGGEGTTTFSYDELNQLLSETRGSYAASYSYDGNGNRRTRSVGGLTETYSYDAGDKLTHVQWFEGSKSFEYDGLGRRTSQTDYTGTTSFTWDHESRLTSIVGPNGTATYGYNGLDSRVSAVDASGTRSFQRDGAYVDSPLIGDGQATYTPSISERRIGATTYLHSGLKNADSRTISSSGIAATRTYDAFGNVVFSTGAWNGPLGYAGALGYQEDTTGLKLLGHRYYDSTIGRFISRDFEQDGRNWYSYCDNNPLASYDAKGTHPVLLIVVIAVAILSIENTAVGPYDNLTQAEADRALSQQKLDAISSLPLGPAKGGPNGIILNAAKRGSMKKANEYLQNLKRKQRNSHLAGKVHPKTGVEFSKKGFPMFRVYKRVRIKPGKSYKDDERAANMAAGLDRTPPGKTWHHGERYGEMELVDRGPHGATGHDGGVAIWGEHGK